MTGLAPWNLNIQTDALLAADVPDGARVLDVGCGDGFLSARLAARGCRVTGLDADAGVLERARYRWPDAAVTWTLGDVMSHPLPAGGFDAVVSNATLHHLPDAAAALARLAGLVRPGGTLGVIGFARNGLLDWPRALIGAAVMAVLVRVKGKWEHTAPQHWPPADTYGALRRIAASTLPGSRYRTLWLGRYHLTWRRPDAPAPGPAARG